MWYRPLNRISLKIVKSFQIIIGNQTPLKLNYMYTEDMHGHENEVARNAELISKQYR